MLGPGIGGLELLIVGLLALIVVGPKDLPVLMRKIGQVLGRARKMAAEFRASFDDMARQSELDDLRKEVEALRSGQMVGLDKDTTFKEIDAELKKPVAPKATDRKAEVKAVAQTPPLTEPSPPETQTTSTASVRKSKPRASKSSAAAKAKVSVTSGKSSK